MINRITFLFEYREHNLMSEKSRATNVIWINRWPSGKQRSIYHTTEQGKLKYTQDLNVKK